MKNQEKTFACQICGNKKSAGELIPAELVRETIVQVIRKSHPDWSSDGYICIPDLNHFRAEHVKEVVEDEKGEVAELEMAVVNSLRTQELFSHNMNVEVDSRLTLGERMADHIASFGGSWRFILLFAGVLFTWIAINSIVLLTKPFDPYPYILLNLVLSCLAAIQAPVIMMSQNRLEGRDRLRSEHDYQVNLKAELEIRNLHEKMDHLLLRQWQKLMEIQQIQMDLLDEIARKTSMRVG